MKELPSVSIPGLNLSQEHNTVKLSKRAILIPLPQNRVMLIRPLGIFTGLDWQKELERRIESIKLHQKLLPEYTLPYGLVVLQGYLSKNIGLSEDEAKPIPVLGKTCEYLEDARPASSLPREEVLSDKKLCFALSQIYAKLLLVLLKQGIVGDLGYPGVLGDGLPRPIARLISALVKDNIFVGMSQTGERKICCDCDWYYFPQELINEGPITPQKIFQIKLRIGLGLFIRTTFFKILSV